MKIIKFISTLLTIYLLSNFCYADTSDKQSAPKSIFIKLDSGKEITIKQNEVVVEVPGIVCSFCSFGLQKNLSKLKYVDRSKYKEGIYVDIENQLVTIAVKPNEKVEIALANESIKSGGYDAGKAYQLDEGGQLITNYSSPVKSESKN